MRIVRECDCCGFEDSIDCETGLCSVCELKRKAKNPKWNLNIKRRNLK